MLDVEADVAVLGVQDGKYLLRLFLIRSKQAAIIHVTLVKGNTTVDEGAYLQAIHKSNREKAGDAASHGKAADLSVNLAVE